jgi:hypothetical protein
MPDITGLLIGLATLLTAVSGLLVALRNHCVAVDARAVMAVQLAELVGRPSLAETVVLPEPAASASPAP